MTPATVSNATAEPRVRGVLFGSFLAWTREAYGEELFQKLLLTVPEPERATLAAPMLPIQSFPFRLFQHALDTMERLVVEAGKDSVPSFKRRTVTEGGGKILKTFYRLLLALAPPTTIVRQLPVLYGRAFDSGGCEVVSNERGRAVVRYAGPLAMERYMRDSRAQILGFMLEQNGARNVRFSFARETRDGSSYGFDLVIAYDG